MEFRNLKIYQPDGTFRSGGLSISGDRITGTEVGSDAADMGGLYAVPGLVDLHFHGCMGYDFCDGTAEAISALASYQAQNGVAAICPATMTYPEEKLSEIAQAAAAWSAEPHEAALVGINMEGPFISEKKKGAQNAAYLHAPDAAMFRRASSASRTRRFRSTSSASSSASGKFGDTPFKFRIGQLLQLLRRAEFPDAVAHFGLDFPTGLFPGFRHHLNVRLAGPPERLQRAGKNGDLLHVELLVFGDLAGQSRDKGLHHFDVRPHGLGIRVLPELLDQHFGDLAAFAHGRDHFVVGLLVASERRARHVGNAEFAELGKDLVERTPALEKPVDLGDDARIKAADGRRAHHVTSPPVAALRPALRRGPWRRPARVP